MKRGLFYTGLAFYVCSFFLPAVGLLRGWECAVFSLLVWRSHDDKIPALVLASGLINIEIAVFFVLTVIRTASYLRSLFAVAALFSVPITWIAIHRMSAGNIATDLHAGHFLWVVGILLLVLPDLPLYLSFRSISWFAAAASLANAWLFVPLLIGVTMYSPSQKDDFFYVVGVTLKEPAVCAKVSPNAIGREDQRDSTDYTYMQSDCYRALAAKLHAPEICDHVKSAGADRLIGSLFTKVACRRQKYPRGWAMPGPAFVDGMRDAGFGDEQLTAALYRNRPDNYLNPILGKLRGDPTFLPKLQASPNYNEPLNTGQAHIAEPLEFVDEMIAILWDVPSLCEKISPDSHGADLTGYSAPLRATCFAYIAFNRRDDALCHKLPRATNLLQSMQAGTAEGCMRNVATLRNPKSNLGSSHYGPGVYPTWPQFQAAMQQLGYSITADWLQLPRPTPDQYQDYLFYLVTAERKTERAAFLRRVLSMP